MNVVTCWKWFEDLFYPVVRKRKERPGLLLLDNAPDHFPAFERNSVKVVVFSPNCTCWKQPCGMEIIAALKKDININISKTFWIFASLMRS